MKTFDLSTSTSRHFRSGSCLFHPPPAVPISQVASDGIEKIRILRLTNVAVARETSGKKDKEKKFDGNQLRKKRLTSKWLIL
jgi:hypothetical protein